jgi:hypothetical protein
MLKPGIDGWMKSSWQTGLWLLPGHILIVVQPFSKAEKGHDRPVSIQWQVSQARDYPVGFLKLPVTTIT